MFFCVIYSLITGLKSRLLDRFLSAVHLLYIHICHLNRLYFQLIEKNKYVILSFVGVCTIILLLLLLPVVLRIQFYPNSVVCIFLALSLSLFLFHSVCALYSIKCTTFYFHSFIVKCISFQITRIVCSLFCVCSKKNFASLLSYLHINYYIYIILL